jgi:poly(3-hydroxyalkanoate) depolymerase
MKQPLQMQTVRIGSQPIRYAVGGAVHAERTLLLFNGIGASIEVAEPLIARFRRTRVVAFDAPGVGGSPAPLVPYRLRHLATQAAALLDRLAIRRADIVGMSWGGAAAQEFALSHPERCHTLTLAATCAGLVMVPGQLNVLLKLLSPRRYLDAAYLERVGSELYGGALRTQSEVLREHARLLRAPSHRGYLYQLYAAWGWTSWHRLHRLRAPTLVLMGDDDPIVPPINGHLIAARLPRATVETIDCGHLFMLTRPEQTAARIERFLAEHPLVAADEAAARAAPA